MMDPMMMDELEALKGKHVELIYNGLVYRGQLVGASEDEVYLKTPMDWVTLPMSGVTTVRRSDAP